MGATCSSAEMGGLSTNVKEAKTLAAIEMTTEEITHLKRSFHSLGKNSQTIGALCEKA